MRAATLFPDIDDEPAGGESALPEPPPRTYHNGTISSRASATTAREFVASQLVRVSEFIESKGEAGATDKECQIGLDMDGNSQRPRRVWLRDNGYITTKGEPDEVVLRNRSLVWVSVRPFRMNPTNKGGAE